MLKAMCTQLAVQWYCINITQAELAKPLQTSQLDEETVKRPVGQQASAVSNEGLQQPKTKQKMLYTTGGHTCCTKEPKTIEAIAASDHYDVIATHVHKVSALLSSPSIDQILIS